MNLVDILSALRSAPRLPGAPGSRDRSPVHRPDDERSAEWNAWRERQSLHPQGVVEPVRPTPPKAVLTAEERYARRSSTRASRRRAARQATS